MSILVNTKVLQYRFSGVQRYLTEILNYASAHDISFDKLDHGYSGGKSYIYEQTVLNIKHGEKTLWSPSNIGPAFRKNQVITIHDTVPFDHPEWLEPDFVRIFKIFASKSYTSSKKLICISEFTRSRVVELFPHLEGKISVIYNGVSSKFFDSVVEIRNPDVPVRYALALSAIEPRKNIPGLISSWIEALKHIPDDLYLVIAGEKGRSEIFKNVKVNEQNLLEQRVIFTGFVPESQLVSLYKNAQFFIYPSFYEGFGLPVLEAMAAGLPVITSNTSSLKEIANKGSILVNPYDIHSISNSIIHLSNNDQLRTNLAHEASIHARKFTWNACSDQTWNVLEEAQK